jgi:hypothetical protein
MLIPKADRKLIHELVLPQPPREQRTIRALETRIHRDVHFDIELLLAPLLSRHSAIEQDSMLTMLLQVPLPRLVFLRTRAMAMAQLYIFSRLCCI